MYYMFNLISKLFGFKLGVDFSGVSKGWCGNFRCAYQRRVCFRSYQRFNKYPGGAIGRKPEQT